MLDEEKNTSEPVDNKTEEKVEAKEELTKTQIINLDKIKSPDIDIDKEAECVKVGEVVETKRAELFAKYKKVRTVNNILMVVAVAFIVMAFIFIVQKDQKAMNIAGYVIAGVVIVALLAYFLITKNKFPNQTKEYIKAISMDMNRHVFNDPRFTKMTTNYGTKIDMTEVESDRIYLKPTDIGSRNVCEGYFNDVKLRVAELALYKQVSRKQRDVVFIGKYISMDNKYKFDGRAIISIKGEKNLDLPTDIEDLKTIEQDGDFSVYATSEDFKLSSILSNKAIAAIKKIKPKDNLVNFNLVLWGGHTAVYISYEDAVISLPFDKPFDAPALEQYVGDLLNILTILTEM